MPRYPDLPTGEEVKEFLNCFPVHNFGKTSWVRATVAENDDVELAVVSRCRPNFGLVEGTDYVLDCLGKRVFVNTLVCSDKRPDGNPSRCVKSIVNGRVDLADTFLMEKFLVDTTETLAQS